MKIFFLSIFWEANVFWENNTRNPTNEYNNERVNFLHLAPNDFRFSSDKIWILNHMLIVIRYVSYTKCTKTVKI